METPLVSICMITYNHASYIAKAIEGVMMQKCDFPIELIIGEDCSTDDTRSIIIKYKEKFPDKIRLILREKNVGMQKNFVETLLAATGKYIALCEGDDFWTDPYKLRKQIDFMQDHSDYSMCCHNAYRINQCSNETNIYPFNSFLEKNTFAVEDVILNDWFVPTASILMKKEVVMDYCKFASRYKVFNGDYSLQIIALTNNYKLFYSNDIMSVYRLHVGGISMIDSKIMKDHIINTLLSVNDYTEKRYQNSIESKISSVNKTYELECFRKKERENEKKWHYKFRYLILRGIRKMLCLKEPSVILVKKY